MLEIFLFLMYEYDLKNIFLVKCYDSGGRWSPCPAGDTVLKALSCDGLAPCPWHTLLYYAVLKHLPMQLFRKLLIDF